MFKGRISRVFDLEPEERGSSANARGSSGQLCLPTLDERVTLYLRAVYGKSDFTREEYSEARKLILNAMAADFAAKSGISLSQEGPETLKPEPGDNPGKLVAISASLPTLLEGERKYDAERPSSPAFLQDLAASHPGAAKRSLNPVASNRSLACALVRDGSVLTREEGEVVPIRRSSAVYRRRRFAFTSAAAAACVAIFLVTLPVVWVVDRNSAGSQVAVQSSPSQQSDPVALAPPTHGAVAGVGASRPPEIAPVDQNSAGSQVAFQSSSLRQNAGGSQVVLQSSPSLGNRLVDVSARTLAAVAAPLTMPPRSMLPPTPLEAFRSGTQALRQGKTDQAVVELEYAAEQGVPGAIWKLGRMYADGDGVKMNKARAYDYFRRLTTMHADDGSSAPNARFLANAFVTLGLYHLDGIPGTLKADPNVAREMFRYAASYFADPEAQYYLGRLFLLGKGAPKDAIQAARWLRLSANKGDHRAQALLGGMLFNGEQVSRQASLGLFWLIVAKDAAGPDEGWITDMYSSAVAQASESERALAHKYLEDWLKNRRETVAAVAPVAPTVAAMAAAPVAPAAPPVAAVAPAAPVIPVARAPLGAVAVSVRPNDITQAPPLLIWNVVRRGLHLLAQGQITDARQLVLKEAQGAEIDAAVALFLGTSYDPVELEQLQSATASPNVVPDSFANIAMARSWYQKAKDLGSIEAERRLASLANRESQLR